MIVRLNLKQLVEQNKQALLRNEKLLAFIEGKQKIK